MRKVEQNWILYYCHLIVNHQSWHQISARIFNLQPRTCQSITHSMAFYFHRCEKCGARMYTNNFRVLLSSFTHKITLFWYFHYLNWRQQQKKPRSMRLVRSHETSRGLITASFCVQENVISDVRALKSIRCVMYQLSGIATSGILT